MSPDELFSRMRDIHVPDEPGWWPPAPGWWLLAVVALLGIAGGWILLNRWRCRRVLRSAVEELEIIHRSFRRNDNPAELAVALSAWLKRVAIYAWPGEHPGGMTGHRWLEFLDHTGNTGEFTGGPGRVFARAVYQPVPDLDSQALMTLCRKWLDTVTPALVRRGRGGA